MAYKNAIFTKPRKSAILRVLGFVCIFALSAILLFSNDVPVTSFSAVTASPSSNSLSQLPSDSYKVRTNAVGVQVKGKPLNGDGVVIGIYDGGINIENPAFITNGESRIISQACVGESVEINGCETDPAKYANNICFTTEVGCFHGMAVAGFAAANESIVRINSKSVDVSGIATSAKISYIRQAMSKKGEIRYSDFVRALNRYAKDVREGSPAAPDVINLSLSFPRSGYPNCEVNNEVKQAVDYLTSAGVIVVAASGNNSDKSQVSYPACMKDVIAVGSSGINSSSGAEEVSDFSNMSNDIDVVAPGESQIGLMPEDGRFVTVSGTSFSAPIVTGAIALLKQANPSITTSEVRTLFSTSSDTIIDPQTGERFANLNVQKLFGADFDNLASKRQLNNSNSNDSNVDSATGSLFGANTDRVPTIDSGIPTLTPTLFSSSVDIAFIKTLEGMSVVFIVTSILILLGYLVSLIFARKAPRARAQEQSMVRLSGYYFDHQLIDLTQDESDREPGDDKILV